MNKQTMSFAPASASRPACGPRRRAGISLLETIFATSILAVVVGTVGGALNSLVRGTAELQTVLLAQNEAARVRIALTNDLQLTDTLGTDATRNPFFEVVNRSGGTANGIKFRTVTGYGTGKTGGVDMVYSSPIVYAVDGDENLVRTQDGATTVIGNRVRSVSFSKTASGLVVVRLTTIGNPRNSEQDQTSVFRISPRNSMQM